MADSRTDHDLHWVEPRFRGILSLNGFHVSRSLRRSLKRTDYEIVVNGDFSETVRACAARPETWISQRIEKLYLALHRTGYAHSIEMRVDGILVGGTYGVTLGGVFFGESMFSRRTDASKIVLAWLVHRLNAGGFRLFDTQFLTPHLASLGGVEIPQAAYRRKLAAALDHTATLWPEGYAPTREAILQSQSRTQTS